MTMLRKRVLAVIEDGGIRSAEEIQKIIIDRLATGITLSTVKFALSRLISMGRVDKFIHDGQELYQIVEDADAD